MCKLIFRAFLYHRNLNMKRNKTSIFFFACLFFAVFNAVAQDDSDLTIIEFDSDTSSYEYYYDWDMPKYSIGLNLNSLAAIFPAITLTHDIGLDDYRRIAIETSYVPGLAQQKGFKLRGTYQRFFYKNDIVGFYCGGGINIASVWEPRVDWVFLENTYSRIYSEIRNHTLVSGIAETGFSINIGESYLLETTLGVGAGVHRAGGSYIIIREFDWGFGGLLPSDPGTYFTVPFYWNLSFSIPVVKMFERS